MNIQEIEKLIVQNQNQVFSANKFVIIQTRKYHILVTTYPNTHSVKTQNDGKSGVEKIWNVKHEN